MNFRKLLSAALLVQITSAAPEETLAAVANTKVAVSQVIQKDDLTYQFQIRRKDLPTVQKLLSQRGDHLAIVKRRGFFWHICSLKHHPILLITFLLIFLSSIYLPSRVFFITVEGNHQVPDRMILAAAENCGIRFGASRKKVRSEKVKNELLSAVDQLQWAGINTVGCTAVISVRERNTDNQIGSSGYVSNLIAARDGYILSASATSGTLLVQPGDTVTKGQTLISGYTDCGIFIRAAKAEGEILAQTTRKLTALTPETVLSVRQTQDVRYNISLLIRKKRINLWKDSRISDAGCGRMYTEYFVSLPGGFRLPIAVCVDRYTSYDVRESAIPQTDAHVQLQQFTDTYLLQQMLAGQIIGKQQVMHCSNGLYRMESSYTCTEFIGKTQWEQIGESNGERN